ncbi:MAG: acyl carrier protein [Xanthobacteraceae bacterium]
MTELEISDALTGLFREILDDHRLALKPTDLDRDIPGFDSAKKVHLVLAVEERFSIRLHSREIDMLRSVADWTNIILIHCNGAA